MDSKNYKARGRVLNRLRSVLFLLPAWFSPVSKLRVFFHRLRGVKIGKNVEIGYFCLIGNVHPYLITIEDGAVITAGSVLLEHDNAYFYTKGGEVKFGPVIIKKRAFIGVHCVIMPNVIIGERSIVGANSVVIENVRSDTVVGGVPAKIIKKNI
jgi:acetyltransferase-like isoleucine patch superfamily enzyme